MARDRRGSGGGRPGGGRAAAAIEEAAALIRAGEDPDAAISQLEAALPEAEDDPALWYHLGYARLQAGRARDGAAALDRSLALEEEPNGFLYLGYAHIELGDFDAAHAALTRCLALGGPEQARYELAYACHVDGRHEEAARHGRRYVTEVPDDPDGWELYDAVCQKLAMPRSYKRLLGRYGDDALVELLEGRDAFSMGEPPFPVPFAEDSADPAGSGDVKLDFLAAVGGAYLGSSADDGVGCRSFRRRTLSIRDMGAALVRLSGVLAAARVRVAGVLPAAAVDAGPAAAAAALLGAPVVDEAVLTRHDRAEGRILWLQSVGHDWLTYRRASAPHGERLLTAVLALDWFQAGLPFTARFTPDITGFVALDVAGTEGAGVAADALGDRILDAARTLPDDEALQQRHFYRSQPGLRFR